MMTEKRPSPAARRRFKIESLDDRMIGLMRLILALSALLIISIDPSQPDRFVTATYAALLLYSAYSALLFLLAFRRAGLPSSFSIYSHWVDVACYLVIVALSSGTSSIFFYFFFFAILVASFRRGFHEGLCVAVVSALLFTVVGYATAPAEPEFELNRFLLRPVYLLVLGYMIAYSGGSETMLKRRLALLKEVNRLSNPRFGVDQTIGSVMVQVRAFYEADTCLLIMADWESPEYLVRRAEREGPEQAREAEPLANETAALLLGLPDAIAVVYNKPGRMSVWPRRAYYCACDMKSGQRVSGFREESEALADTLGVKSFITVPLLKQERAIGRLFLTSNRSRFHQHDLDFLCQIVEHTVPVMENIRLLDRLATEAAEQERQKISRDLHDSAVQPYIGLKLGLDALRRKVAPGNPVSGDVEELIAMASDGISDLRSIVGDLRDGAREHTGFLPAVRRHAAKFSEFYHIKVDVRAETAIHINDRLAAEAFQILREGLSNIRRHTLAECAFIHLACDDGTLVMSIGNDGTDKSSMKTFVPRSISERATALGGRALVEQADGHTTVRVEIPL